EHGPPGDLAKRTNLYAWVTHRYQEERDPLVLRRGRIRPRQADRPVRLGGKRGPDLLPGQPPARAGLAVTADANRLGPQRRQVRAGLRLAEQLAPGDLAGERRPGEPGKLLGRAVVNDRRDSPAADAQIGPLDSGAR